MEDQEEIEEFRPDLLLQKTKKLSYTVSENVIKFAALWLQRVHCAHIERTILNPKSFCKKSILGN